jgi:hypothetical protein
MAPGILRISEISMSVSLGTRPVIASDAIRIGVTLPSVAAYGFALAVICLGMAAKIAESTIFWRGWGSSSRPGRLRQKTMTVVKLYCGDDVNTEPDPETEPLERSIIRRG